MTFTKKSSDAHRKPFYRILSERATMSALTNWSMAAWEVGQWKWIKNKNKSVRQPISHTTIAAIFLVPLCRAVMHTLQKPSLEGKADVVEFWRRRSFE